MSVRPEHDDTKSENAKPGQLYAFEGKLYRYEDGFGAPQKDGEASMKSLKIAA